MTRFLATGDSHIGKGISLYPERLAEQQQVWQHTLELARSLNVDAVLHAGDLFDSRRPTPDAVLAAERPLVQHAAQGGCPVVVVAGNHDLPSLDGPCGLDILAEAGLVDLARGNRMIPVGSVDVCCLPWAPSSRILAQHDADARADLLDQLADLLVTTARGMRHESGRETVLLGHWSATGSSLPNGMDVAQLGGVTLDTEAIAELDFDAVVLGHIHRPQHLRRIDDRKKPIVYVGSPMPLDHGEATCDHGVWLVEPGLPARFIPIESRRFVTLDYAPGDIIDSVDTIRDAVVRVRVRVTEDEARGLDVPLLREMVERSAHVVTGVHVEVQREERERPAAVADDVQPADALAAWLDYRGINGTLGAGVIARAGRYLEGASS